MCVGWEGGGQARDTEAVAGGETWEQRQWGPCSMGMGGKGRHQGGQVAGEASASVGRHCVGQVVEAEVRVWGGGEILHLLGPLLLCCSSGGPTLRQPCNN